jgi:hypothetical protein
MFHYADKELASCAFRINNDNPLADKLSDVQNGSLDTEEFMPNQSPTIQRLK